MLLKIINHDILVHYTHTSDNSRDKLRYGHTHYRNKPYPKYHAFTIRILNREVKIHCRHCIHFDSLNANVTFIEPHTASHINDAGCTIYGALENNKKRK